MWVRHGEKGSGAGSEGAFKCKLLLFHSLRKPRGQWLYLVFFFSLSGKVHEFLALNKLSSLQLPTRKLNFQVLNKSLVITNTIIPAVTAGLEELEGRMGLDSKEK